MFELLPHLGVIGPLCGFLRFLVRCTRARKIVGFVRLLILAAMNVVGERQQLPEAGLDLP